MLNQRTFNDRLPGVICETGLPTRGDDPLRMDIAGFVGFAERGPVDVPVLIEDINQFVMIFGGDFAVALDDGVPVYAHLYQTVNAFFENGGRTCYVVRVAGATATRSRFVVPGLLADDAAVSLSAAWVGRWSRDVQIGTQLRATPLKVLEALAVDEASLAAAPLVLALHTMQGRVLAAGDVLRLHLVQDAPDDEARPEYHIYGVVDKVSPSEEMVLSVASLAQTGLPVEVQLADGLHYFATNEAALPMTALARFGDDGWLDLPYEADDIAWTKTGKGAYTLRLPVSDTALTDIDEGDLLRVMSDSHQAVLVTVRRVRRGVVDGLGDQLFWSIETDTALHAAAALPTGESYEVVQVDLLSFDLQVREGQQMLETWTDLRFAPSARYWRDVLMPPIARDEIYPLHFTVADFAPYSARLGSVDDLPAGILPLGMDVSYRFHGVQTAAMGDDGLAAYPQETLFYDAAFAQVKTFNLMRVAHDLMYLATPPRRLRGVHALLPLADVSLIAIPDAVHGGWEQVDQPEFQLPSEDDTDDTVPDGFHDCPPPPDEIDPEQEDDGVRDVVLLEPLAIVPEAQFGHLPTQMAAALYDVAPLLTVHQLLVTLCAARADCVAILSLPAHYERRAIDGWHEALSSLFMGTSDLSFAAAYHGWAGIRETTVADLRPVRYLPPEGVVIGTIADRTIKRAVWIAPANIPFRNVVALRQQVSDGEWAHFYNRQLNILRRLPGRYAMQSATTLSPDRLLVQLSVRRLMIFLRKVALREGQRYVFETNNERFRALVQTYFERVMSQIMDRGGIAAFQVVTGAEINTPNDMDNGRFLIAIKFAPTLPIEFITIVLLRSGDDGIDILERS